MRDENSDQKQILIERYFGAQDEPLTNQHIFPYPNRNLFIINAVIPIREQGSLSFNIQLVIRNGSNYDVITENVIYEASSIVWTIRGNSDLTRPVVMYIDSNRNERLPYNPMPFPLGIGRWRIEGPTERTPQNQINEYGTVKIRTNANQPVQIWSIINREAGKNRAVFQSALSAIQAALFASQYALNVFKTAVSIKKLSLSPAKAVAFTAQLISSTAKAVASVAKIAEEIINLNDTQSVANNINDVANAVQNAERFATAADKAAKDAINISKKFASKDKAAVTNVQSAAVSALNAVYAAKTSVSAVQFVLQAIQAPNEAAVRISADLNTEYGNT